MPGQLSTAQHSTLRPTSLVLVIKKNNCSVRTISSQTCVLTVQFSGTLENTLSSTYNTHLERSTPPYHPSHYPSQHSFLTHTPTHLTQTPSKLSPLLLSTLSQIHQPTLQLFFLS
ncbi:hypothetical protein M011DRAFT_472664 [Sporormia fimetaria CBS 119925]|uniref:Uncharacterized protein n=1 Tax=Sporormia fimetaria CBS 119925 TaxID=1340428 RepID=A0A6A6UY70_9PLEO|nr:hypothetical protein M011DRAFT_472664 [Sporormia fimetaria CBS 119925]